MADEVPMMTSCPLCLAPDEVQSMVKFQIQRVIAGGRTWITICRSCARAVVDAVAIAEPPLLCDVSDLVQQESEASAGEVEKLNAATRAAAEEYLEGMAESAKLHEREEPDDGTSTDCKPPRAA